MDRQALLEDYSKAVTSLVNEASKSVVRVGGEPGEAWGAGTGILFDDIHVLTASHVLLRVRSPVVTLIDGRTIEAKVVGRDPISDLAILRVSAHGLQPMTLGDSDNLMLGQWIMAISNPRGTQPSVSTGIVSALHRSIGGWGRALDDVIVADLSLYPGSSGGPLVDARGTGVGMNIAFYPPARAIALPINTVKTIAQKLVSQGRVRRAYLGISVQPARLSKRVAENPLVGQEVGLLILGVELGSPADRAKLSLGDTLTKFNGRKLEGPEDLYRHLTEEAIGRQAKLQIIRGGEPFEVSITPREAVS